MVELGKLGLWVAGPVATGTLAVEVVTDEHVKLVALIAATVGVVVAVVAWVDRRITGHIRAHAANDRLRHRKVLSEIRHLRELLHVQFGLPKPELEDEDEHEEEAA